MPRTYEELEAYLQKLERHFERVDEGTYLIAGAPNQPPIAARVAPPVVLLQVPIGPAPGGETPLVARLFRRLLELNGNDLLHAAYSLEGGEIVLSAALELDNLDLNEIEAVLADMDIALAEHVPSLREMVQDRA
jgi:hypothetical protein